MLIATSACSTFVGMKHVSILALENATLTSIDSSQQLFNRINDFLAYQHKPPFYQVELVGAEKEIRFNDGLFSIHVNKTLPELGKTDVIVIPLLCGNFSEAIEANKKYHDWIISNYRSGAEIVCLCVGSFFLASTGLLKNKKCAIHWAAKNEFEHMFPEINLVDDTIITDEDGIYTCAGGYSYLNLLLYIIEKQVGKPFSVLASKMFEIDIERKSQNPFVIFMGQKRHRDETVLKAQEFIEQNPTQLFAVEDICKRFNLGRRTFERRFKKSTSNSVTEYIQRVKVEFAKKQLETTHKTVNEIIYEAGYNNIDAFRSVFKKYTSLSPVAYRKKYTE